MPQTTISQQKQKKMLILLFGCIVSRTQRKGEDTSTETITQLEFPD